MRSLTNAIACRYKTLYHVLNVVIAEALRSLVDNDSPALDYRRLKEAFIDPERHQDHQVEEHARRTNIHVPCTVSGDLVLMIKSE